MYVTQAVLKNRMAILDVSVDDLLISQLKCWPKHGELGYKCIKRYKHLIGAFNLQPCLPTIGHRCFGNGKYGWIHRSCFLDAKSGHGENEDGTTG